MTKHTALAKAADDLADLAAEAQHVGLMVTEDALTSYYAIIGFTLTVARNPDAAGDDLPPAMMLANIDQTMMQFRAVIAHHKQRTGQA